MTKKKPSIGTTIGGALVGLDFMIMKTGKPPAEQVESAKPDRPVPADGGGTLTIELPEPVSRDGRDERPGSPTSEDPAKS